MIMTKPYNVIFGILIMQLLNMIIQLAAGNWICATVVCFSFIYVAIVASEMNDD